VTLVDGAPVKAYIDNDVVSGFRRRELKPDQLAAIDVMKALADAGTVTLVVSAVHDREAAPLPEQYREEQLKILALFPRVEFADDHHLYGFNTLLAGQGGRSGFVTAIRGRCGGATPPRDRSRPAGRASCHARDKARVHRVRHLR